MQTAAYYYINIHAAIYSTNMGTVWGAKLLFDTLTNWKCQKYMRYADYDYIQNSLAYIIHLNGIIKSYS